VPLSPALPYPRGNELASALRRHTGLSISVEDVTAPKTEVVINVGRDAN
jgi:hypothetical protein